MKLFYLIFLSFVLFLPYSILSSLKITHTEINPNIEKNLEYLFIDKTIERIIAEQKIKAEKTRKKNISDKLLLDSFYSEINSEDIFYLFDRYSFFKKMNLSYDNRLFLNKIKKEIVKKEKKVFPVLRKKYALKLNELYSEKYISVSVKGKNNEILFLDWYYFASKDKRHLYLDKLKFDLKRLHFKKIMFDNSINNKKSSYLIQSLNDTQLGF